MLAYSSTVTNKLSFVTKMFIVLKATFLVFDISLLLFLQFQVGALA